MNDKDKKYCEELEAHRKAFMNRINFVFLEEEHRGTETFPYDEGDLALYLYSLFDRD